jgi:hypothetical protein
MSALPVEVTFTDLEREFMENEPPGLFPQNQDSYWGQLRKVTSDKLQEVADLLGVYYLNQSVDTVNADDMTEWETQFGIAAGSRTLEERRSFVKSRLVAGPFTRTRRRGIIEAFIVATFGVPITFDAAGVPFDAGGIPFFGESSTLAGTYRVYEDVQGFTYAVWIKNTTVPDIAGLTRELARITPSGIGFTIDNAHADVLDYFRLVRNAQPVGYWRMGTLADFSGYGENLTASGGAAIGNLAAPGLLHANVAGAEAATDLDGVDDYFTAAHGLAQDVADIFSVEAWVRVDGGAVVRSIMGKGVGATGWYVGIDATNHVNLFRRSDSASLVKSHTALVAGTTYHVVVTKNGTDKHVYINGVDDTDLTGATVQAMAAQTNQVYIGATEGGPIVWNGVLDEVALYNFVLDANTVLDHYNTGHDIATY